MTKYHLIGVGGIGMSALAHLLLEKQEAVSGSDLSENRMTKALKSKGAVITKGHHARHIEKGVTVVYSSAVKADNPEYLQALELECPILHRSELLAQLMRGYQNLAVAGSHGKTSTTALLSHVLMHAGLDPSYALGGLLEGCNGHVGKGKHFVFEADESDGTFETYLPDCAIVTNLDHEHLEHYGTFEKLKEACDRFCSRVKHKVVYCKDDPNLNLKGISYGFSENADVRITKAVQEGFEQVIYLTCDGKEYHYRLPMIGRHNALNSAAVFALTHYLGLDPAVIFAGMGTFPGVGRRMERKNEEKGILFLDDYAHHPTEIATTLEGIKRAAKERRVVVAFQPHRYSRTQRHFEAFVRAFDWVDLLYITDIYSAGEEPIEGITSEKLAEEVSKQTSVPCHYLPREEWTQLNAVLRPHDVFVSMGAGDITTIHNAFDPKRRLKVTVVYGGRSCEHEISCRSAQFVMSMLDEKLYEIDHLFIDRGGLWHLEGEEEGHPLLHPKIAKHLAKTEIFFPVLHGPFGEDGTIQGFFEMLGKPYVGSDWASSALSMNKMQSKMVAAYTGVNTPKAFAFCGREWQSDKASILSRARNLQFPVYVKPNHLGSSIGISKVYEEEELEGAIDMALATDVEVMIEEGIENARELEFAVMGNHDGFFIEVPAPGEKLAGGRFVDWDLKYTAPGLPTTTTPELDEQTLAAGQEAAWKVYKAMGCSGMTRVDFLLDPKGQWWFFELNPIPGMQKLSLFPKIWAREGVEPRQLLDRLIVLGLDRAARFARYSTV